MSQGFDPKGNKQSSVTTNSSMDRTLPSLENLESNLTNQTTRIARNTPTTIHSMSLLQRAVDDFDSQCIKRPNRTDDLLFAPTPISLEERYISISDEIETAASRIANASKNASLLLEEDRIPLFQESIKEVDKILRDGQALFKDYPFDGKGTTLSVTEICMIDAKCKVLQSAIELSAPEATSLDAPITGILNAISPLSDEYYRDIHDQDNQVEILAKWAAHSLGDNPELSRKISELFIEARQRLTLPPDNS